MALFASPSAPAGQGSGATPPMPQGAGAPPPPAPPPDIPPELQKLLNSPTQEDIIQVLRDDQVRSYRVDIETDSTIEADEQADRQGRTEFVTAVGGFLQQALPVGEQLPELVPMIGEMLLFLVRGFAAGRQLEESIETAVTQIEAKAKMAMNQPPQPPPEVVIEQARQETEQQRIAAEQQKTQATNETAQAKIAADQSAAQAKFDLDRTKTLHDISLKQQQHGLAVAGHRLAVAGHMQGAAEHQQQVTTDQVAQAQAADQETGEQATLAAVLKQLAALGQRQEQIAQAIGLKG